MNRPNHSHLCVYQQPGKSHEYGPDNRCLYCKIDRLLVEEKHSAAFEKKAGIYFQEMTLPAHKVQSFTLNLKDVNLSTVEMLTGMKIDTSARLEMVFGEDELTAQSREIVEMILPMVIQLFVTKSKDYELANGKNVSDRWGVVGQYMKLADKVDKLERPLFIDRGKGEELKHESVEEVLMDIIGHALLTILKYNEGRAENGAASE